MIQQCDLLFVQFAIGNRKYVQSKLFRLTWKFQTTAHFDGFAKLTAGFARNQLHKWQQFI